MQKKSCTNCNNKTRYSKELCLTCYKKKNPKKFQVKPTSSTKKAGTQEKKKKKPKLSKKQIKRISERQIERLKRYRVLRDEYLLEHPICERCEFSYLVQLHHKSGRIGDNLFKEFCSLCNDCHLWVHQNPKEAKEQGFLLRIVNNKE